MREVRQMLAQALGREEVIRMARAQAVLRHWEQIVGDSLAARSWPDKFERGTVWVAVEGSAWAQELRMIKERILERLCEFSGDPTMFVDVRFGVRPLRRNEGPEPKEEHTPKLDTSSLSILEIAERRLQQWTNEERA